MAHSVVFLGRCSRTRYVGSAQPGSVDEGYLRPHQQNSSPRSQTRRDSGTVKLTRVCRGWKEVFVSRPSLSCQVSDILPVTPRTISCILPKTLRYILVSARTHVIFPRSGIPENMFGSPFCSVSWVKPRVTRVLRMKASRESSELEDCRTRGRSLLAHEADAGHAGCLYIRIAEWICHLAQTGRKYSKNR